MTNLLDSIRSPADLKRLPIDQLPSLAAEIRARIVEQVSRTGGHLAPNLGVVELTIALHYVFDFAHDRLLFDVGHQCYPHKLLTGRADQLAGLRTSEGMSGFPDPRESSYDLFAVGHAGTAISTGVGMARGDTLNKEAFDPQHNAKGRRVVCFVGDASIVNGVALEGLNNAGTLARQFLVILNDNGMSISHPQGAMAQYFDRLRINPLYSDFKRQARKVLNRVPGGRLVEDAYHRFGEATKAWLVAREQHDGPASGREVNWFEHFGLMHIGPVDGHDLPSLIEFLAEARDFDRPMVLHVKTIKGKGIAYAEQDATTFHSPSAFSVKTDPDVTATDAASAAATRELVQSGCRVELKKSGRSFTGAFGEAMRDLMARDEKIVAATAAMPDGTGISKVLEAFPDRTWDTGICESHAMDMMAGLAKTGLKPFFAVYCTFLQRAFDQAFQEVSLQGLAVRLCLDRAGLVGGDGAVHHGFCDVAILRTLPGAVITAAIDEPSLRAALEFMRTWDSSLSAVRYPRDNVSSLFTDQPCPPFVVGKARALRQVDAPDAAVLAFGTSAIDAMAAASRLDPEIRVSVYDARFAKPVDRDLIRDLLSRDIPVVTVEDHSVVGGFGAAVLEAASEMGLNASRVRTLGIPDHWIYQNSRAEQLAEVGIDAAGIEAGVRDLLLHRPRRESAPSAAPASARRSPAAG